MARTRQQAKRRQAKRREQERRAQGTTGEKRPSNPAEQAVVQQAEAYEVGDVLEETGGDVDEAAVRLDDEVSGEAITPVEAPEPVEAPPARVEQETPDRKARKQRAVEEREDGRRAARRAGRGGAAAPARPARRREARQRGRVLSFVVQVWAELRRVQWPDRAQVTQATAVVIVFCILAGLYLAFFDFIFSKLVKAIL